MQGPAGERVEMHRRAGPDAILAGIAGPHLAVTRAQIVAAGLGPDAIARRARDGRLARLFRGVYRVGPLEAGWTREAAALLAGGPSAVLSHESAAGVWGIRGRPAECHVTVVAGHRAGQRGLSVHHARLDPDEIRVREALRVTSPERTLLDLAAVLGARELARAVNEAEVQRIASPASLRAHLARRPHHRGARALAAALADEPRLSRSEAERRMLALIRRVGLPEPSTNAMVLGREVDFLWPAHRLIVETDGYGVHGTRSAFERDRRRDAAFQVAGYVVLRFTWWQLEHEPEVIAARLAAALALSASPASRGTSRA